jgi:Rrf2 family iron-sulfur cluster assembly transcriptional regulator
MLSLSQTTGHAIHALSYLSHENTCLIREIAETTGIGKPYLAKIVNLLTNKDLVATKRGYRGGILLARPAGEITLLQIVEAVEGDGWSRRCLLGMRNCDENNLCPTHDMWAEMKSRIRDSLGKITLAEVGSISEKQNWAVGLPPIAPLTGGIQE